MNANEWCCLAVIFAIQCATASSSTTSTEANTAATSWTTENMDVCASDPCLNGSCFQYMNTYACSCIDGYTGSLCESDVDECATGTNCLNGATCSNVVGSFTCACVAGYTGLNCENEIDECASHPCLNAIACADQFNAYSCRCAPGYTGVNCETDIDGGSCVNGTCEAGVTDPSNELDEGFSGFSGDGNQCESVPCLNGGTCNDNATGYTCICTAGYTGADCETDINDCLNTPCQNGGSCTDGVNSYTCVCVAGYTGANCETDVNDCLNTPCLNGGSCTDGVNSYTCSCVAGYTGTNCETDINDCLNTPCLNGGTCTDGVNSYTCACVAGYTDSNCQTDINECGSTPCQNGATCADLVNSYSCTCVPGYTGINCETDINECASAPCLNGATCADLANRYACACVIGYTGLSCETDIDECASWPCRNLGTCIDGHNGYSCVCPRGITGVWCETNTISVCVGYPCQNDAQCEDNGGTATCRCFAGFTGSYCEAEIDECSSSPCLNGGICSDEMNGYLCNCIFGYTGSKCESDIDECLSNPCKNAGTCTQGLDIFWCSCPAGFTGTKCETNINECASRPCLNDGKCIDGVNGYTCECLPGCNGTLCEHVYPPTDDAVPVFSGPFYAFNATYNRRGPCTEFQFTCRVTYASPAADNGARFDVSLAFDGQLSTSFKTATSQELEVQFTHEDLRGHFGTTVSCSVRSYWVHAPSVKSNFTSSVYSYYFGIVFWTDNKDSRSVQMNESSVAMPIHFELTLPVACSQCAISVPLSRHTGLTVSKCSVTFASSELPGTVHNISVRAVQTPGTNSRVAVIRFSEVTAECDDTAWNGYRLNDIPVLIVDEELAVTCVSDGDPHIRTFDSAYFSVYFEGDFLLWKSVTSSLVEVHARFQQCLTANVSCNCAVAFREDNNIVGVYACDPDQPPIAIQYLRDPNRAAPRVQIGNSGLYFYITMPSGRAMSVSTVCVDCGRLTITLYSISEDLHGHSEGLCGNFNGDDNDDRIPMGGTESENQEEPVKFAASYMIPANESFINGHIFYPSCMPTDITLPSECQCGQPDSINCDGVNAAANVLVPGVTFETYGTDGCISSGPAIRQKRQTRGIVARPNVIAPEQNKPKDIPAPPDGPLHANTTETGDAISSCEEPLNMSPVYKECAPFLSSEVKESILKSCGTDVHLTGNAKVVIDGILSKYNEACRRGIQQSDNRAADEAKDEFQVAVSDVTENGIAWAVAADAISTNLTREALTKGVGAQLCGGEPVCSGNGTCEQSVCVCNEGWTGDICNIPENIVPVIVNPINGPTYCDVRDETYSVPAGSARCTIVEFGVITGTFRTDLYGKCVTAENTLYVVPSLITAKKIRINLPLSPLYSTSPNYTWAVAISNDNVTFTKEEQLQFFVFDSKCLECSNETKRCQHKKGACIIDGKCYSEGERDLSSTDRYCYGCLPEISTSTWTRGWVGISCSRSISDPPLVTRFILGSSCDYNCLRIICDVQVHGRKCSWSRFEMNTETFSKDVVIKYVGFDGAHYSSVATVSNIGLKFNLPVYPLDSEAISANYTWFMSASNDNKTFTNETMFVVFDSKCMECSEATGECRQKLDTCIIDGKCYTKNERFPVDECFGCLPESSNSSWTRGWVGSDCSQSISVPPVVTMMKFGTTYACDLSVPGTVCDTPKCDARVLSCSTVSLTMAATSFWTGTAVKCVNGNTTYYPSMHQATANRQNFDLPLSPLNEESSSPYYKWAVYISNDNETFGDVLFWFFVYDSKCMQDCSTTTGTCQLQIGKCIIKGKCYDNLESDEANENARCLTSSSTTEWTIDVDDCQSLPCLHGGSCSDLVNRYTCKCASGFTGFNCETDVYECQSQPCLNGGNCSDIVNGYTCECANGFTGVKCETGLTTTTTTTTTTTKPPAQPAPQPAPKKRKKKMPKKKSMKRKTKKKY